MDATNFLVDVGSSFTVNFELSFVNPPLYETWNTRNYTNFGTLFCDSGFRFDRQITNAFGATQHLPADNFYSLGNIFCASSSNSVVLSGSGELLINATNILLNRRPWRTWGWAA